ncbi:MAG: bifunctional folylpolyglutamate synthase/dihydrofolate synthase [Ruminococcus sp.]|nr:bifunctional folylpolyglutamate synthase/dihydrofolate synthase [Ruminococcus sp.]
MLEYSENKAIEYINGLSHSGKPVKDLTRIRTLLAALGDPQDRLKFVHIAGTNGKGSMAQMFSEVFTAAGFKTGLFTSPYIIKYSDRIKVNGENIPDRELSALADRVRDTVSTLPCREDFSQFEITQAIAFLYFLQEQCDIVVLETGMGGLLDCTNAVKTPILTVIGSVDYDHTAVLGNTLEEIAFQKAGIIKPGVPCVLSAGNAPEVISIVRKKAEENGSRLVIPDTELLRVISCGCFGSEFEYRGKLFRTSMGGAHQITNAMSVIEGISLINGGGTISREKTLCSEISYEEAAQAIERASIPGRIQIINRQPLTILDGAHNPDGIAALADVVSHCGKEKCTAVIGMCRDKNIREAVANLIPFVESFITVDGFSERAESKEVLSEMINSIGGKALPAQHDIPQEIRNMQQNNPDGLNLICGSLFLATYVINAGI